MVRVLPGSLKTLTSASMEAKVPLKKFQSFKMTQPIQTPRKSEMKTCRVLMAKRMATNGGSKDHNP